MQLQSYETTKIDQTRWTMAGTGIRYFATNRAIDTLGMIVEKSATKDEIKAARKRRLALEKGGYYFIDANVYMSHYLATVDREHMPEDAVVEDSSKDVLKEFLLNPKIGRVVVCVHGFNVELHHAVTWFRILTETMSNCGFDGSMVLDPGDSKLSNKATPDGSLSAFIGFSWPSNGSTLAYNRDQADAVASGQAFANLLARLRVHGKEVDLICHSMGNYLACNAMAGMVKQLYVPYAFTADYIKGALGMAEKDAQALSAKLIQLAQRDPKSERNPPYLVQRYVMIAPDVERRHVTKSRDSIVGRDYVGPFYSGLEHAVDKVINVYSRFDGALAVSTIEKKPKDLALKVGDALASLAPWGLLDDLKRDPDNKWEMRLGSSAHPGTAPGNMRSINATELAGRPIDHSDHIDSREIAIGIAQALELQRA